METITFHNISYKYKESTPDVLQHVNASLHRGEWTAVIGPNGSGKSTLSRLCNGLLLPSQGRVAVEGRFTDDAEALPGIRQQVGMVFQNPDHQFVAPTVRDDIAFGMENAGVERRTMEQRVCWAAEKTGVSHLLDTEPHRLSGGQKQRVAIAGVLALQPDIMILDEASSMLDPHGKKAVLEIIQQLHRVEKMTVLSVTHDLHEAMHADRVWYMEDGRLVHDWRAEELREDPGRLKKLNMPLPYSLELLQQASQTFHDPEWMKMIQEAVQR